MRLAADLRDAVLDAAILGKLTESNNIENSIELFEIIKPENWVKYLHTNEITSGNRNNGLNKIAYKLKQMGADANLVFQVLQDINQTLNPPLDYAELRSIVKGKFK